jgi:hypothetical protein
MPTLPHLAIHPNKRYLQTADGLPFFWLGDTAWELFHRLSLQEVEMYLDNRSAKGFNIVQGVAIGELDGLLTPNRNGDLPLMDCDPAHPIDAYYDHVVRVVDLAAERGLYMGVLPTWGDKVNRMWGGGPEIFNSANAFTYAHYLGGRLRGRSNVIWILGGDRGAAGVEDIWRAMAAGLDAGMGEHRLMTYHPYGEHTSGENLHTEAWLDFNMVQSGHGQLCQPCWGLIESDYHRKPVKPVLDGEPNYEDIPIGFTSRNGYFTDLHVRRQIYRSVFAGGFGVTYGHNSIWQMYASGHLPLIEPVLDWRQALDRPAAFQLLHLKKLMLSRPFFQRIPAQEMIRSGEGFGAVHVRATCATDGSYAMVYFPQGGLPIELDCSVLTGPEWITWWYNPRTGLVQSAGVLVQPIWTVAAPLDGPDWVLVIDSSQAHFQPPGVL